MFIRFTDDKDSNIEKYKQFDVSYDSIFQFQFID